MSKTQTKRANRAKVRRAWIKAHPLRKGWMRVPTKQLLRQRRSTISPKGKIR